MAPYSGWSLLISRVRMSRSALFTGLMAALLGGNAVGMPVSCELPSTQAVCPVPTGLALQAATDVYSEATERGLTLAGGRGTVGELRFGSENWPPTWQKGLRALTSVASRVWLVPSVNSAIRRLRLGPKTPRVAGGLLAPPAERAFQRNQSPSLKP